MFEQFRHLKLRRSLVVLDTETTGPDPQADRLIDLGVVIVGLEGGVGRAAVRFDPGVPIPPAATAVHGITDADVAGYPPFAASAAGIAEALADHDLAGFNLKRYDLPLLLAEFARAGVSFDLTGRAVLDAQEIFFRREPRTLSAAIRFYCGEEHAAAHGALADAEAAARVLDAQLERYPDLPREAAALHDWFVDVDLTGRFRREGDQVVFAFGKYRGRALAEVAKQDPGYLMWLSRQPLLPDASKLLGSALADAEGCNQKDRFAIRSTLH